MSTTKKVKQVLLGPASIVDAAYPHTGVTHPFTPDNASAWYEHRLSNGRIAVVTWLYEGDDATRRTIIVREWNNPESPILVRGNVYHAAAASHATVKMLAELEKML
jgi:hypothetical protein